MSSWKLRTSSPLEGLWGSDSACEKIGKVVCLLSEKNENMEVEMLGGKLMQELHDKELEQKIVEREKDPTSEKPSVRWKFLTREDRGKASLVVKIICVRLDWKLALALKTS